MARTRPPRGVYVLRDAAKNMLRYTDKYGRKFKEYVPETSLDRYEIALAKIVEGCETLLTIRFEGEDG